MLSCWDDDFFDKVVGSVVQTSWLPIKTNTHAATLRPHGHTKQHRGSLPATTSALLSCDLLSQPKPPKTPCLIVARYQRDRQYRRREYDGGERRTGGGGYRRKAAVWGQSTEVCSRTANKALGWRRQKWRPLTSHWDSLQSLALIF